MKLRCMKRGNERERGGKESEENSKETVTMVEWMQGDGWTIYKTRIALYPSFKSKLPVD